jgi:hypothetical protein
MQSFHGKIDNLPLMTPKAPKEKIYPQRTQKAQKKICVGGMPLY